MKRLEIVGLCTLAVLATGALAASAAQAAGAEYGQCVEQKKGEYTEANCATKSKVAKKGKFEFVAGPSPTCVAQAKGEYTDSACAVKSKVEHKGKFEKKPGAGFSLTGGAASIEVPGIATVECSSSNGAGAVIGVKSSELAMTFEGCHFIGHTNICTSEGEPAGDVTTLPLLGTLIGHGETGPKGAEPASGEAWAELTGKAGGAIAARFNCGGGIAFEWVANVAGVTTPTNTPSGVSTLTFAKGGFENNLETAVYLSGEKAGTVRTPLNGIATLHFAETDEFVKAP
jgi:hypothetical protein